MNEKQNNEEGQPPSGIISKLKRYFRNPFFIKTQSVSEVTEFLKDALDQNIIDKEAESIATKAIKLGDITAKEIMIPKVDMITIQIDEDTDEIIKKIIDSGHSRYPVLGNERNEVIGILLAKDILAKLFKGSTDFNIGEMLRDSNAVPETKKIDTLLEEFKEDKSHLAVVIDEDMPLTVRIFDVQNFDEQPIYLHDIEEDVYYDLNEVNLLNAKLLYTNKIFKSKNLTESQKVKVLGAFDKAGTVKETKLVFETLNEGLKAKKPLIKESLGATSKATGNFKSQKPIIKTDPMVERFQKLAGLK